MTAWVEGKRSFFIGAQAFLYDNEHETAASWATPHIEHNPAYKYVIGRFVEADRANNNRQLFSLQGLQMARPTITHAPMNMNHSQRRVVGAYIAAELVYPIDSAMEIPNYTGSSPVCATCGTPWVLAKDDAFCPQCEPDKAARLEEAVAALSDAGLNPYIEALGVFWRHYFPEEYDLVEHAHAEGRLFYSMECIPAEMQCVGDGGCGETFEYAGRVSDTYCDHLNKNLSDKYLIDPHFTAGAILVPPISPGWARADIHSLIAGHAQLAERIYDGVRDEMPHLDAAQWEAVMGEILVLATR